MAIASTRRTASKGCSRNSASPAGNGRALAVGLPFEQLNPLAELESWRKEIHRPVYHVHKWWANRLGSVFRAVLLAGLEDADADVWAAFYERHDFRDRVVLDPFMGSGTTVGEALKLGCRAVGIDINPVAYFQVRKALEHCDEGKLQAAYRRLEARVGKKIRGLYRSTYEGVAADVLYAFWVKVLPCPDCATRTRLFSRWIFSSNAYPVKKPESLAVCPKCGEIVSVLYRDSAATCGSCRAKFNPQAGPANGQRFVCEGCGKEHRIIDVVRRAGKIAEHEMYALMLLLPDGRKVYKRPDAEDLAAYSKASRSLARAKLPIPADEIPPGYNTDQARGNNYRYWREMFNDRQLYALGTLLSGILEEPDRNVRENLLLLFSGMLEFNNMFCSFKGEGTGAVRHLFHHHILKPERTPLEANPWGTERSSGAFSTLFERRLLAAKRYCADPFELMLTYEGGKPKGEKIHGLSRPLRPVVAKAFEQIQDGSADALLLAGDSSRLPLPDASVDLVVTDPPYFDNVNYSELADFFYCWLKLGLNGSDAAFGPRSSRHIREVQGRSAEEFGKLLGGVFTECARVLKPGGLLAFTFHHSRDEAWVALVRAIEDAGLEVVAAHPVKAEMSVAVPKAQAKEPIALDLVVVCQHPTKASGVKRSDIVALAVEEAADTVRRYNKSGVRLSKGDVRVVLMGGFLKAHSRWLWHGQGSKNEAADLIVELTQGLDTFCASQAVVSRPPVPATLRQGMLFDAGEQRGKAAVS